MTQWRTQIEEDPSLRDDFHRFNDEFSSPPSHRTLRLDIRAGYMVIMASVYSSSVTFDGLYTFRDFAPNSCEGRLLHASPNTSNIWKRGIIQTTQISKSFFLLPLMWSTSRGNWEKLFGWISFLFWLGSSAITRIFLEERQVILREGHVDAQASKPDPSHCTLCPSTVGPCHRTLQPSNILGNTGPPGSMFRLNVSMHSPCPYSQSHLYCRSQEL
ncbi:hypothetical protein BS47DRAFT_771794 [Hydnum rufescens UP504]|uniref:Uncharacterized protein n=1 Tax=Hydnum rufescens UP504 TaxID=1448309 RepID=A0A9P6B1G0_9AGAM|nr:hypothetical protein BS47DRAFT_771794 [Hydnum rufescens UP504]